MLDNMFNKLKTIKLWNLLWISLILSEAFTAIMNIFMGLIWYGKIDVDLLLIGAIDAFIVALFVTIILILLLRQIRNHERHSEEAILRAKEEWERIFNAMSDLVMVVDTEYRILNANKAFLEKFQITASQAQGEKCYRLLHNMDVPPPACFYKKLLSGDQKQSGELQIGDRSYMVTFSPLHGPDGALIGAVHVAKDITEQKETRDRLHRIMLEQSVILENASVGITLVKDRTFVWINKKIGEIFGYAKEELEGHNTRLIYPTQEAYAQLSQNAYSPLAGGDSYEAELELRRKDGSLLWGKVRGKAIAPSDLDVGIIWILEDISKHKQVEQALKESEDKFRTLFESATDAILIVDLEGNFIDINKTAHERLGYSKAEMLSLHLSKLDTPEFAVKIPMRMEQLEKHGQYVFESAHQRKDGASMPVEINARIIDFQGKKALFAFIRDITKRKQDEKALRENERYLQTIIETEPECIKLLAADGALLQMNRAGLSMIDADSLDQVKGQCMYPLVVPEYREAFKSLTKDVFNGKSGMLEFEAVGLKGRRIWLDTHAVPLRNDKDEIIALLGITRDVTEHKRAETALRESEKRFRILFNSGNDAIVVHRPILEGLRDNFLEVNDVACQRLGYSREELLGLSPADIDDPNDPLDMTAIRDAIRRDKQALFEKTHVTRDGRKIPVEINARLFDWNGEPVILSVVRDITERKRAEEKLRETNTMLQTLIQAIPDVVFFKDAQNRYLMANKAAEGFMGLSQGQLAGKTDEELLPPDLAEDCRMSDARVAKTLKVVRFEEQYTRADKKGFLDTIKAPVFDDQGNLAGLVGVSRDITERKQMEEELHRRSREKDTLLQEIHHRVKNNMQVISSLLNLQAKSINEPRMSAIFEDCQSRIRSMALVHEELYQSKNLSQIDIKHYINALLRGLSSSVYKKATVRFKVTVDDLFFNIDTAIPCGLIITEIVTNSFKHAFPKQAEGEIALALHRKDDMFQLSVRDNGVGLPLDFDLAKTQSLGLQLIHTLARQLGGTVEMKSVQGTETTIMFKERKNRKEVH